MPARAARARLLAATLAALAALTLTACRSGEGLRDEGPSSTSSSHSRSGHAPTGSPYASARQAPQEAEPALTHPLPPSGNSYAGRPLCRRR
ncbi:hypothetical protein ABZV31_33475 [Streptomyces sp. NPDC005202]|uniref:hypothetical protein n=1 Tax=Streptomyces sp. NPDC005202 TaxID=3157021 RepID=UPI0033B4D9BB